MPGDKSSCLEINHHVWRAEHRTWVILCRPTFVWWSRASRDEKIWMKQLPSLPSLSLSKTKLERLGGSNLATLHPTLYPLLPRYSDG